MKYYIWLVAVAVTLTGTAVFAQTDAPLRVLTAEQEEELRNFAASLIVQAPNVELSAVLSPPTTSYRVRFVGADERNLNERFAEWVRVGETGQFASGYIDTPSVESWDADLSCGTWVREGMQSGTWSHPDGTPPSGCPHEQGTSHPGTISVRGRYSVSVHLAESERTDPLIAASWTFTCRYSGSESGTAQCQEELEGLGGRFGDTVRGARFQPPSMRVVVSTTIAIVVAAVLLVSRRVRDAVFGRVRRFVRPVTMRDPR